MRIEVDFIQNRSRENRVSSVVSRNERVRISVIPKKLIPKIQMKRVLRRKLIRSRQALKRGGLLILRSTDEPHLNVIEFKRFKKH